MDAVTDAEGLAPVIESFKTHLNGDSSQQTTSEEVESKRENAAKRKLQLSGARTVETKGSQSALSEPRAAETDADAIWASITKKK